ncbi:MAG: hypothetical protein IPO62_05430 [Saprospiraceae bacterium]|nr:hypothetical protein [Saprospiraceae bacterium]MBK9630496.1 hypothetical protein [Saprospiraceae bacterium]
MLNLRLYFYFMLMLTGFFIACEAEDDSNTNCTGVVATYDTTVKSHLNEHCAISGCHAGPILANGMDLSTYASAKAIALAPGSKMICAIEHGSGCVPMPQGGNKLDASVIKVIKCWVENGAPQ